MYIASTSIDSKGHFKMFVENGTRSLGVGIWPRNWDTAEDAHLSHGRKQSPLPSPVSCEHRPQEKQWLKELVFVIYLGGSE